GEPRRRPTRPPGSTRLTRPTSLHRLAGPTRLTSRLTLLSRRSPSAHETQPPASVTPCVSLTVACPVYSPLNPKADKKRTGRDILTVPKRVPCASDNSTLSAVTV